MLIAIPHNHSQLWVFHIETAWSLKSDGKSYVSIKFHSGYGYCIGSFLLRLQKITFIIGSLIIDMASTRYSGSHTIYLLLAVNYIIGKTLIYTLLHTIALYIVCIIIS